MDSTSAATPSTANPTYSLPSIVTYFLRLGTLGFGGPVALVGLMRRDLVEQKGWISESDYKEGLALAQLAPGPLAAQLAIYLGYVHYRILGATLTGIAFIIPSFVMVVLLGMAYTTFGGLPWMQAVFFGVGACVIGIITNSAYKLATKSLGKDRLLWAIFLVSLVVTALTESENLLLFLMAGVLVWLVKAPPKFRFRDSKIASVLTLPLLTVFGQTAVTNPDLLWRMFLYFAQAGAFVFGSGLAIVPFLYGGVVKQNAWLTDRQFLDAVAVAMITPGPVVITVGFIGYLVAAFPGALIAAVGTFLPCYLFTVIPAPYFKKYGKRPDIAAFVDGVTTAAVGAITGAVIVLGRRTLIDIPSVVIALVTLVILWRKVKIPEPVLVLIAAIVGLVIYPLMAH